MQTATITRPLTLEISYYRTASWVNAIQAYGDGQFLGSLPDYLTDHRVTQSGLRAHIAECVAQQFGYRVTIVRLHCGGATIAIAYE